MPRLKALRVYWAKIPPLSVLMAMVHGVKPTKPQAEVVRGKKLFDMIKAAGGNIKNVGIGG